jgi:hypothetical protein
MARNSFLRIAVRAYPLPAGKAPHKPSRWRQPYSAMLVLDTETRIDHTQALTFGSYRFIDQGACVEEGLIVGDDLSEHERAMLTEYASTHRADVARGESARLKLRSRREFIDRVFFPLVYKGRALVVGFNLPFDLARLAVDATPARDRHAGGFSLVMSTYGSDDAQRQNRYRPNLSVKHLTNKSALLSFVAPRQVDAIDRIPFGSRNGTPEPQYTFRGHFLDLRTLAFALTDRGYSLESACQAFGVEHGKARALVHGVITPEYIDYNRRDVLATTELAAKLLAEYDAHPIALQATKAFSAASMGKGYLRAMGIVPIVERQPDFPAARLGHAQSAFFGGRTSAHIRKTVVPVVYTDFLSMYPTVNALMGLWRFVTAEQIQVIDDCAEEVSAFLHRVTAADLHKRETWRELTAFVRLVPDGDVLPARGQFADTHDWQIGLNYLHGSSRGEGDAVWYALPDVVASVLQTGRVPTIVDAFRIVPHGTAADLRPTKLAGHVHIDPAKRDLFVSAIEERRRVAARVDWSRSERERIGKGLKVFANAASYGIYAEMHRQESNEEMEVQCHGIDPTPFTCRVAHPEVPGEYCFPPLASLITSAARLMLGLLEHAVTTRGGTYAMEDTDSMAIVASEAGGLVACPGGPLRLPDGREAIKALTWNDVADIVEQFSSLNPYDAAVVPGSVLKVEDDNFDPDTKRQQQLYCFAISSKRYALFTLDSEGTPTLTKWSEHGLGHLCNPTDLHTDDRTWIPQVWLNIIRRALGLRTRPLPFEQRPAIGRVSISSPAVMRPLAKLNEGKPYGQQLKPFNFMLTCHVRALGHPSSVDPEHFHLIAPYESDPERWTELDWIDQYSGNAFRITTEGHHGGREVARVKTYGDVFEEYEWHPETKCADADGEPASKQTVGLLHRRHITIDHVIYIGRESNQLEDVEAGKVHASDAAYTEYGDSRRDYWQTAVVPALKQISLRSWQRDTGKSAVILIDARRGRRRPHARNRTLLIAYARKRGVLT